LIEKQAMTLDLYEILGQCTWGQAKLAAWLKSEAF
jgi:hypothetical protein